MTVLIAGAGVGGLTLGLTLHALNIPFRIFEAVKTIQPMGLGLMIQPQAVREYQALGLEAELSRLGLRIGRRRYFNEFGQEIWEEPRGLAAGYQWAQFAVHRGYLQTMLLRTLLRRAGPHCISYGARLSGLSAGQGGVTARFEDRQGNGEDFGVDGRLLVGADGINSRLRALLHPQEGAPRWDGATIWRGMSWAPRPFDGRSMIAIGSAERKFLCYPVAERPGRGCLLNWLAVLRRGDSGALPDTNWRQPGRIGDFLHRFADWGFDWLDVPGLIGSSKRILEYPMVDREPLDQWSHGPLTLLGDAAHPMYPTGSNGASHAVIDARYLGRALRDNGLTETALQVYDDARRVTANRIVLANRGAGPKRILEIVAERAPGGFDDIEAVMPRAERQALVGAYTRLVRAEVATLNARPPLLQPCAPEEMRDAPAAGVPGAARGALTGARGAAIPGSQARVAEW